MADLPPVETVDDAMKRASDALRALKNARPGTAAEGRMRAAELVRQQQELIDTAHKIADGQVAKRFAGANGHGAGGFTEGQLDTLVEILAHCIAPHLQAIEKRIAELEARPALEDAGTWNAQRVFKPGNIVTHEGSAWVCKEMCSNARPGQSDCWRLMVKHGKDARGSR